MNALRLTRALWILGGLSLVLAGGRGIFFGPHLLHNNTRGAWVTGDLSTER